ncbi:MAG: YbjN domain-containing protein [Actinomycetota bacterium]|nr:YbjN domain-containing protein [Actinomycetota bacterium]
MSASEREAGRRIVLEGLAEAGLAADQVAPDVWLTALSGERKRSVPVLLRLSERSLHLRAFLCGALDEGHAEVYRFLLERNQYAQPVHFALDEVGEVLVTGQVPLAVLDPDSFDRLLGAVLTVVDEVYFTLLRRGFAGYVEVEQRWREQVGLPPNPISSS